MTPVETTRFYTDVLGLTFSHAMGEDHVPSTGKYSPHVHIFIEMEDGSNIAFFEVPKDPANMKDLESPDWIRHFAFEVESVEVLLAEKLRLESVGLSVVGPTNHDDFILSIYFFDPSGHGLELTTRTCEPARDKVFEAEAESVLAQWAQTYDWSQRENVFGAKTGHVRPSAKAEARSGARQWHDAPGVTARAAFTRLNPPALLNRA